MLLEYYHYRQWGLYRHNPGSSGWDVFCWIPETLRLAFILSLLIAVEA
jgi:hypothetical protein